MQFYGLYSQNFILFLIFNGTNQDGVFNPGKPL